MKIQFLALTGLLAATALVSPAFAQDVVPFDKEKVCAAQLTDNGAALEAARKARPDAAAMRALLADAVKRVPGNNICLADLLTDADQDIANILGELADSGDIETAAGPGGDTPAFGGGSNADPENPSQLNQPIDAAPASPAAPVFVPAFFEQPAL